MRVFCSPTMQQCAGTSRPHCTRFAGSIRRCGAASSAVFEACVSAAYSKTVHCFCSTLRHCLGVCAPLAFVCPVCRCAATFVSCYFSHLCLFLLRLVRLSDCCPMLSAGWLCQSNTIVTEELSTASAVGHCHSVLALTFSSSLKKAVVELLPRL